ncbi:MAG TPA: ABC transporter permease subunit [Acidimicrobiales bacterium]|nr:ABC transporter permease subunit [Acidimicrobiales bacterium]
MTQVAAGVGPMAAPARHVVPVGRRPGAVVATEVARKAGRSGALWGLVFAFYVVVQTLAYVSAYKTQASRDALARAFGTNIGINALIGPARAINTVAGYASWRALGILSLLGGIWGLLTSTRLLRGDEEAGRYELLLAGQTTRRRAAGQAMGGLGIGLALLFVVTAVSTVLTGLSSKVAFGVGASVYFSVTLVAGAAMFLAVGALTSQLANTRRRAASMAAVVFGAAYALRMVADSDPTLHWLVWLSPLGWIEESKPLTDPHPLALVPVVALIVVCTAVALHLAGTRDLGAATLADRDSAEPHLGLLSGPTGLAVRMMRPVALGWLFAVAAMSVLIGTIAEAATKAVSGANAIEQALGRIGGHGSLVNLYLGLTFLFVAIMLALIAAGQVSALRTEEAEGRLDNLLVRPLGRVRWYVQRLVLSTALLLVAGLIAGIGAWAGAASQHTGVAFGSLIEAGLNIVPPAVFLLGLGALTFGARPRWCAAVVYGYLAWAFLVEFVGAVVHTSHWILDTSVLFHLVPAPAASPDWTSAAAICGIGVAGAVLGGVLFRRRDTLGA